MDRIDAGIVPFSRDLTRRFKDIYSGSWSSPVEQQRAKLAQEISRKDDMNRLYSQLADLNVYLQRTQMECEAIAEKCGGTEEKKRGIGRSSSIRKKTSASKKCKIVHYSVSFSSSVSSESGKGSMTESEEAMEDEVDALTLPPSLNASVSQPEKEEEVRKMEETDEDERIEQILKIAEDLACQVHSRSRGMKT